MKAIEYLEEQKFSYDHFTELTSTGINPDNNNIAQFAEDYHQAKLKLLGIGVVTKRWLFWFESEGKDGYTFEIEAEDSNDAYDKAYDSYGPQVAGMMYQVI